VDVVLPLLWPASDAVTDPTEPTDVDAALVARAQRRERGAFDTLVRRHQQGVWRLVRRYLRNDADAADVTQQAFVRAYRSLDRFRGEASVRTWLYRIGINLALNHLRDHAREQPAEIAEDALSAPAVGANDLLAAERGRTLRAAVAQLPPKQKLVLELRVFDDLPFREVAVLAECSENAAKVSFHYAVKKLRELLGPAALALGAAKRATPPAGARAAGTASWKDPADGEGTP
jgi:RNA polymerase sigma-70 factor (ECF subfamily)